jgi:hypothetical protein
MSRVAPLDRLASASAVFFGQHGDVPRHASEHGVSRQRLYRQADGVLRDLEGLPHQQQVARLQQQVADLRRRLEELQAQQPFRFFIEPDKQAEFATERQEKPLDDQDDHFHLLRERTRALRRLQGPVPRALGKAEKADRKRAKVERQGRTTSGTGSVAARAWRQAEAAFQRWRAADEAWQRVRQEALPLFGPSGQLNTRAQAEAVLAEALPAVDGREWAKVRRPLKRPGFFTFPDRVSGELAALPAAKELVQAAVEVEGARRRPEASSGTGPSAQGYRAVVLVAGVLLALAGEGGAQALARVRGVLRRGYRANSAVEGLNSIVRMHPGRHRRLTQGLLDVKRLSWNCRTFRTGQRQKHTPYGLLGLKLPTSDWWQLIKIPPQELRQHLSGQQPPP